MNKTQYGQPTVSQRLRVEAADQLWWATLPEAAKRSCETPPSAAESLQVLLASNHEIAEFLNELAKLVASEVVNGTEGYCGILLSRNKRKTVVGHSDQTAKDLD